MRGQGARCGEFFAVRLVHAIDLTGLVINHSQPSRVAVAVDSINFRDDVSLAHWQLHLAFHIDDLPAVHAVACLHSRQPGEPLAQRLRLDPHGQRHSFAEPFADHPVEFGGEPRVDRLRFFKVAGLGIPAPALQHLVRHRAEVAGIPLRAARFRVLHFYHMLEVVTEWTC